LICHLLLAEFFALVGRVKCSVSGSSLQFCSSVNSRFVKELLFYSFKLANPCSACKHCGNSGDVIQDNPNPQNHGNLHRNSMSVGLMINCT